MSWEAAKEVLALAAARLEGMSGVKRWRQKKWEKREGFLEAAVDLWVHLGGAECREGTGGWTIC